MKLIVSISINFVVILFCCLFQSKQEQYNTAEREEFKKQCTIYKNHEILLNKRIDDLSTGKIPKKSKGRTWFKFGH